MFKGDNQWGRFCHFGVFVINSEYIYHTNSFQGNFFFLYLLKCQKIVGFLMFSGIIERKRCPKMS